MAEIVCLYHYPCIDGIYAALVAREHFERNAESTIRFYPLKVYEEPQLADLHLQGRETVFFLDYTGPTGFAEAVAAACKQVIVLDHHLTAAVDLLNRDDLPSNLELHIDLDRSGAGLARDYFGGVKDANLLEAISYVQDGDLWRWALPGGRSFYAALRQLDFEFDANANPKIFDTLLQLSTPAMVAKGEALLRAEEKLLAGCLERAFQVQLGGAGGAERGFGRGLGLLVEDKSAIKLRSDLGNRLAAMSERAGYAPIGAVVYTEDGMQDNMCKVSLRGIGDSTDTTAIARLYGGGGHRLASSCCMTWKQWQTWGEQL